MDIATLTTLAVTALTTFFAGAADGAAHKAGESVYEQSKHIYEAIKSRFSKEADGGKASQALATLASDSDYQPVVEQKLVRILQADPAFLETLHAIVQAGPHQGLTVEEEGIARRIRQSISGGEGEQNISVGKKATGEDITQEIR